MIVEERVLTLLTFIVWRELHGHKRVQILCAFCKQVIPPFDEAAFVLIVDKFEGIVRPGLFDLLYVFFEGHFTLCLNDDFFDEGLVLLEAKVVHMT